MTKLDSNQIFIPVDFRYIERYILMDRLIQQVGLDNRVQFGGQKVWFKVKWCFPVPNMDLQLREVAEKLQ